MRLQEPVSQDCKKRDDDGGHSQPHSEAHFGPPEAARQLLPGRLRPCFDGIPRRKAPQVSCQSFRRVVAIPRFLSQALDDDRLEILRNPGVQFS